MPRREACSFASGHSVSRKSGTRNLEVIAYSALLTKTVPYLKILQTPFPSVHDPYREYRPEAQAGAFMLPLEPVAVWMENDLSAVCAETATKVSSIGLPPMPRQGVRRNR